MIGMSIQEQFETFAAGNPRVYIRFRAIAQEIRARGLGHYSAKAICEVIRWEYIRGGRDAAGFKLNNNYTSRLARRLIADDPTFQGFFRLRELKSA